MSEVNGKSVMNTKLPIWVIVIILSGGGGSALTQWLTPAKSGEISVSPSYAYFNEKFNKLEAKVDSQTEQMSALKQQVSNLDRTLDKLEDRFYSRGWRGMSDTDKP